MLSRERFFKTLNATESKTGYNSIEKVFFLQIRPVAIFFRSSSVVESFSSNSRRFCFNDFRQRIDCSISKWFTM